MTDLLQVYQQNRKKYILNSIVGSIEMQATETEKQLGLRESEAFLAWMYEVEVDG